MGWLFSEDESGQLDDERTHALILDDIDRFLALNFSLATRTIYIGSPFDPEGRTDAVSAATSAAVIKGMHILDQSEEEINIILNSPGGDSYHGLAIYDAIASSHNHVTITAYGYCMSAGSLIFQAGDKRIIAPHTWMMIHEGSAGVYDTHSNVQSAVKHFNDMYIQVNEIYSTRSKLSAEKIKEFMGTDTYFTAEEAVKHGLADSILGKE